MLGPTTQYQLPTPIAHTELEQDAYKGYRIVYDHYPDAMSYDDSDVIVPNRCTAVSGFLPLEFPVQTNTDGLS
jgi:hypothetical protein